MGPCHAGAHLPGPCAHSMHTARLHAHTARHSTVGRPGALAGDPPGRPRGAREGVGVGACLPSTRRRRAARRRGGDGAVTRRGRTARGETGADGGMRVRRRWRGRARGVRAAAWRRRTAAWQHLPSVKSSARDVFGKGRGPRGHRGRVIGLGESHGPGPLTHCSRATTRPGTYEVH